MTDAARIFQGKVVHKRLRPKEHRLHYRVFTFLLDVDQLGETERRLKFFSVDRFNIFSLYQRDHGSRDGKPMSDFAWDTVKKAGMSEQVTSVHVLLYPRIFGFAFNPITVYFCLDQNQRPALMIYEVRNTFGENLTYVLKAGPEKNGTFAHSTPKAFYVSPFNKVDGDYTFHVTFEESSLAVGVALKTDDAPLLRTHYNAAGSEMSDFKLLKLLITHPLMTLKVVAGINWEALKLWVKGMKLTDRPPAPATRIVFGDGDKSA